MNKKCLMIITDGFEELEALGTYAILSRGGIKVDIYSLHKENIIGSYNLPLNGLKIFDLNKLDLNEYDALIIAGGREYVELEASPTFIEVIKRFYKNNKIIAAICAGPTLLGHLGYLENKNYTCFQAMNEDFKGNFINNKYVVTEKNIITAVSCAASIDFGLAILEKLSGKEITNLVKERIYYSCNK